MKSVPLAVNLWEFSGFIASAFCFIWHCEFIITAKASVFSPLFLFWSHVTGWYYCAFHQVRGLNFFKLQKQFEITNNKTYLVEKLVFSRSWRYPSADHWFKIKPTIGIIVFLHCKFPLDFVYPEASISGSR